MVTDPVGDLIVRIKNAGLAGHDELEVEHSLFKMAIAQKLCEKGFVGSVGKRGKKAKKMIEIGLLAEAPKTGQRVLRATPRISGVERISRPGRRVYRRSGELKKVRGGMGALILSTAKGILTDEEARTENIGGEVLFKIW